MKKFEPQPGFVVQAYRFALDPNASQDAALRSHCGAARAAYNWAVAWVEASWWQRKAEISYGIAEDELTGWRPWSLPALRKEFNAAKHTDPRFSGWWEDNSKEAYNTGLANAAAAFDNYAKSRNGNRKGPKMGMPRFKSKRKARLSCRFTTGAIRADVNGRHVTLPRLGTIRVHEPTGKLLERLQAGTARILSATVRHERGRWFVSFQVEVERPTSTPARPDIAVGVDLGIKTLAVLADSTGEIRQEANPRHLRAALTQLRRASRTVSRRQGPDRRTGQKASKRWEKANKARNKIQHRVANLRENALHQLTTRITREYGTVVVEDLNVTGMLRNRSLARSIADASFGEIRQQLTYKTTWNGGTLHLASRWFPSSKTCSGCGAVKTKLSLHIRTFECDTCGLVIDRDDNAALNLAALAVNATTGTGVAGDLDTTHVVSKPRGADQRTSTTAPGRKTRSGLAGGATPPHRRRKEARDRTQTEALTLW